MSLTVVPAAANFAAGVPGSSQLRLINSTAGHLAVKIRCSDNALYKVRPIFAVVPAGGQLAMDLARAAGPAKPDKLVIQSLGCADPGLGLAAVTELFRAPRTTPASLTVALTVTAAGGGGAPVPSPSGDFTDFQRKALEKHNELRKKHGAGELRLSKEICAVAQEWADKLAASGTLSHRPGNKYGENCAMYMGGMDPVASSVGQWYAESANYKFDKPGFAMGTGHFTQLVWAGTKELGIAAATTAQGKTYIVANYNPAGNWEGDFPHNVQPAGAKPISDPPKDAVEGPGDFSDFQKKALDKHNELRRKHGAPELRLNKDICRVARDWANRMAATGKFAHRPENKYGENIGWFSPPGRDPVETVVRWYNEINDYKFDRPGFAKGTGHFTQVVWAASRELGVATATANGKVYVVANYDPPGNYVGRYPDNVKPPKFATS